MITRFTFLSLLFGLLLSCSTNTSYYVLAPAGKAPARQGLGLGIGPIIVADYLVERPYLIFQSSPHKMEMSDLHQWSGALGDNFARVLGTNLGRRVVSGRIQTYPWDPKNTLDYQISADIHQFHGTADGDALLEASWRIYRLPEGTLVTSRTKTLTTPLQGDGYEALVSAQSSLVDMLAAEIEKSLRK
ncbi:PqiC family protein [Akkermansiaceae bacterium]|nr:PqiC family protein [Akkermansiaceae bacterium]